MKIGGGYQLIAGAELLLISPEITILTSKLADMPSVARP